MIEKFSFGSISIDGVTYDHDVVIEHGEVRKRKKKASKELRNEFGLNDLSLAAQNDLYEIICVRYETASLIITSNRKFAEWQSIFENQLLASAAMDRLIHKARKFVIEGKSYRLDSFSKLNSQSDLTHS